MDTQYTLTLEEASKWKRKGKHVEIGVEVDGNQQAHVNALEKLMRDNGTFYSFAKQKGQLDSPRKGILSKNSGLGAKHERFRIAAQVMLQQKMWFPEHLRNTPDMQEFVAQIKGATHVSFTRSDDGCFTGDTLIEMADGTQKEIKYIKDGDMVITSSSTSAIAKASDAVITGIKEVRDYYLSDGTTISMTDNHPVYTTNGWVYAEDLTSKHEIVKARRCINKLRNSDINGLKKVQDTINQHKKLTVNEDGCTNGRGNVQMEFNQKDMKYITKTITSIITSSATWNFSLPKNTQSIIEKMHGCLEMKRTEIKTLSNLIVLDLLLQNGIVQMKEENGIETIETISKMLYLLRTKRESALSVEQQYYIGKLLEQYTVPISVNMKLTKKDIKIQLKKVVSSAEKSSKQIEQIENTLVVKSVLTNLTQIVKKNIHKVTYAQNVLKSLLVQKVQNTAQKIVKNKQQIVDEEKVKHLKVEPALSAEDYLKAVTQKLSTVGRSVGVVTIIGNSEKRVETVYNFSVEDTETYLVNGGVVVHNCDLITMALVTMHVYYPSYEVPLKQMTTKDGLHYYEAKDSSNYSAYDSY